MREAGDLLAAEGLAARLIVDDFFSVPTPSQLGSPFGAVDAVIGNPPFIRYQEHVGQARKRSARAALAQGVRLSGLASSWAALLVHACGFLKPEGRLAMVLPAELLTVHYAEPVRRWLRERFAAVHLVMFERLQFADALEKVVLVIASGTGGCEAFSLYLVGDADDLPRLRPFDHLNVTPAREGKWTDLLLPIAQRQLFKRVTNDLFVPLCEYGSPELGTVTGANGFFALNESTRVAFGLTERQLKRVSPPGTRHLTRTSFTEDDWVALRDRGEPVWLLHPHPSDRSKALASYIEYGEALGVPAAYKCRIRSPWWRPPAVSPPDLFFTYMSHRYPRLIENAAGVTFLNSMHGLRLASHTPPAASAGLPLLTLNSLTMLGAEIHGRSYGGGILKMEPREAARLPVPAPDLLVAAWKKIRREAQALDSSLQRGHWESVVQRVDQLLLRDTLGLNDTEIGRLVHGVKLLRDRRLAQ